MSKLHPPADESAGRVARSATLWRSFGYAWQGLRYVLRTQRNFRIHLAVTAVVVALGLFAGLGWLEWAVIAVMVVIVLAGEMINTVIEAVVDMVTQEYHPLAKVAKDVAAAAVLLAAVGAAVVGLLVIGPHLLARLGWRL